MWPSNATSRHQADRLARSWLARRLVLARPLPEGAGRALVLAARGVQLLNNGGVDACTGKDIGETVAGNWLPPSTWRHDLLAAGVLVSLYRQGWSVYPEPQVRRQTGSLTKWPDGVAQRDDQVLWIEVEAARKTGPAMRQLAEALCVAAEGTAHSVLGLKPTAALVAYRVDALDERGHGIDHRNRVRKAISAAARCPIEVTWGECTALETGGVSHVKFIRESIQPDIALKIRRVLDAGGWQHQDGCLVATYGARRVHVWEDDDAPGLWGWSVGDRASREDSCEAAKRAGAAALAQAYLK